MDQHDTSPRVMFKPTSSPNEPTPPPLPRRPYDKHHIVYIILFIHGVGTLMPWNMFINAQDYFRFYKLASPQSTVNSNNTADIMDPNELEYLRKNFLSYLTVSAQVPNVFFNGLNLIANLGSGYLTMRVNTSLIVEAFVFGVTILLAILDSFTWQKLFFYLTMISVVILNMAGGIYQNCIFAIGAKFPGTFTNAILIGSNFSGTFISVINLLSIWLAPAPQDAAMYYFITALFVILVCLISFNLLKFNVFFRYFDIATTVHNDTPTPTRDTQLEVLSRIEPIHDGSLGDEPPIEIRPPQDTFKKQCLIKWNIFKKCWPQCLNVFLTFYVTLAPFPAVLADIGQKQGYFSDKYFVSVACFLVFNLFAMLGNLLSGLTSWPGRTNLWKLVVARFLFIPFFLFCNFHPSTRKWPILIEYDIVYIIGNILFALSSGYLSSLCMMFMTHGLKLNEAPKGGMIGSFFLVLGIFLGVNSSFLLTWIVEIG